MKYEVWTADLNSLYNEVDGVGHANFSFHEETCENYILARQKVAELSSHDTAAWIQDSSGNVIA